MIYNYFKIAFRNLAKYKFISFINLFGLTVGLSCCFLILTFILHELSYDKYQPNANQTYRITRSFKDVQSGVVNLNLSTIAPAFGPLLQNDFKEIVKMTRTLANGQAPVRYEDKMYNESNVYAADEKFFDFFKTTVTEGNPQKALTDPYSVMLSEKLAEKYFGKEEPMNKILMINIGSYANFKVTGVYKSFPSNTHFHPEMLVSFNTLNDTTIYGAQNLRTNFGNNAFFTYISLPEQYDPQKLEAQFPAFLNRNMAGQYGAFKPSQATSLALQKLTDIHLYSHTDYEAEENGDIKFVYIFSGIALFILLIACINYMNLSTARATLRAKEIGIRKVAGAQRREIILQFLSESVLISWIAMFFALCLTSLLLPALNKISGQELSISILFHWQIMVPVLIVPFVVGILSGIYPALFMSSFQPVKVLKGFLKVGGGNISFRKVLVTAQFAISIVLIICTAVVFNQMRYMQTKSLGFDKDHIVTMPYSAELDNKFDAFRTVLLSNSNIKNSGRSSRVPTGRLLDAMGARIASGDTLAPVTTSIKFVAVDQDFISTYGVKMAAGRGFSRDFPTDTSNFIINEAAVRILGFKTNEDAVGKNFGYANTNGKLIGIINDFHFESLRQKIVPLVLILPASSGLYNNISVKIAGNNVTGALADIEKAWKKFAPETAYQYTFLDDKFNNLYKAEEKQRSLITIFACLAIFIACLGLFGLSAFAITQRIKEIGIRKVLGASVPGIVQLVSKDFLKLVVVAAIIAFPIAWFAMNKWLEDFAYRTSIHWWIFIIAGIIATIVAFVTIAFHAISAANANPVKNLRTE
ncbi:MAG: ABC transporter permease [Ferruginibacter sp.]